MMPDPDIARLRRCLLDWFRRRRRDLPWRRRPSLYRTLVAEFMLQQTRVDQALPYYRRFMQTFPSLQKLAAAPLSAVVKQWEGLGYYRRAEQLHRAARRLAAVSRPTPAHLESLPGVGRYTRAAIASIVFAEPWPAVDGNVRRVMARLLALPQPPETPAADRLIRSTLARWISKRAPGAWNQAIMELGARVCTPRSPGCPHCPLSWACRARARDAQARYPVRRPTRVRPHRQIAAAVIQRADGHILIAQRLPDGLLPNLWEFPGGKQEDGEDLPETCRREIREELGIDIEVGTRLARIDHAYSHFSVTLHAFACRLRRGRPRALGCQAFRWVSPSELSDYPFPRANRPVVEMLRAASR